MTSTRAPCASQLPDTRPSSTARLGSRPPASLPFSYTPPHAAPAQCRRLATAHYPMVLYLSVKHYPAKKYGSVIKKEVLEFHSGAQRTCIYGGITRDFWSDFSDWSVV